MTGVLFVCLGNICRSPAAESIFAQKVEEAGVSKLFHFESAGTAAYHSGENPDPRMIKALGRRGYTPQSRARKVKSSDFASFDHILAMDESNFKYAFVKATAVSWGLLTQLRGINNA